MRSDGLSLNVLRCAFGLVFLALAGCDYAARKENEREQSGADYRSAMADYAAGRLDQAIKGFEKVVRADPGNSSARFQLACLQQDRKQDYLAALCNYREYLLQCPSSDKHDVAMERADLCEKLLAPVLAKKMNLMDNAAILSENEKLKAEIAALQKTKDELQAKIARTEARVNTLAKENERVRRLVTSASGPEESTAKPVIPTDRELLDDDETAGTDRVKFSADVKNLVVEEQAESSETPFAVAEKRPEKKPVSEQEPPHEERPPEYVVQEGDTLYQLAMRFYGRKSAWKLIRDANRALISTDGRIRTGLKIKLP